MIGKISSKLTKQVKKILKSKSWIRDPIRQSITALMLPLLMTFIVFCVDAVYQDDYQSKSFMEAFLQELSQAFTRLLGL